jgi:Domain of unknown function (DUF1707)
MPPFSKVRPLVTLCYVAGMRYAKLRPVTDFERMRVSDADREQALVQLREHAAAGRLGLEDLEGRSELAFVVVNAALAETERAAHRLVG